jgi:hypothetical protein
MGLKIEIIPLEIYSCNLLLSLIFQFLPCRCKYFIIQAGLFFIDEPGIIFEMSLIVVCINPALRLAILLPPVMWLKFDFACGVFARFWGIASV